MPQTLSGASSSELEIKKSRFIGCVQPVRDRAEAQQIVAGLRAAHPAAAHVCWALMAGGQSAAVDDGEPSGTAGRPMLEVLRHQDLEGVLATVVRYYGGVKLGAGGLVRAYTDAVAQALIDAPRQSVVKQTILSCEVPYAHEGVVRRLIDAAGASLHGVVHGASVHISAELPADRVGSFRDEVIEATQGRVVWLDDASAQGAGA